MQLSVREVSKTTKIPVDALDALERERHRAAARRHFFTRVRPVVRGALGLHPEQTFADFVAPLPAHETATRSPPTGLTGRDGRQRRVARRCLGRGAWQRGRHPVRLECPNFLAESRIEAALRGTRTLAYDNERSHACVPAVDLRWRDTGWPVPSSNVRSVSHCRDLVHLPVACLTTNSSGIRRQTGTSSAAPRSTPRGSSSPARELNSRRTGMWNLVLRRAKCSHAPACVDRPREDQGGLRNPVQPALLRLRSHPVT